MVFWLWLTVSLVVLAKRRWNRRYAAATTESEGLQAADRVLVGGSPSSPIASVPGGSDAAGSSAPLAAPLGDDDPPADGDDGPRPDGPPDARALVRDMVDVINTEGSAVDRPDDAARGAPPPLAPMPVTRTGGIAEALQGIQMPCDLAPLTLDVNDLDPVFADLVTTGVDPAAVTTEIGTELTRLGYEVTELGPGEQLATRDGTEVHVKVHDRPAFSVGSQGQTFTTAPPDSIVVEFVLT